jgi:hypothetical protein
MATPAKFRIDLAFHDLLMNSNSAHAVPPPAKGLTLPEPASTFDWGDIHESKFNEEQLAAMKKTRQRHCFSTLNHNLAYCDNDTRVIKWLWSQVITNKLQGGARSLDD